MFQIVATTKCDISSYKVLLHHTDINTAIAIEHVCMNHGIEHTLQISTSSFKNTAAGYFTLSCANFGAIVLQGPHLERGQNEMKGLYSN